MGSKYFVDVINAGEQSVSVAGGSDADLKLTEGSNTWTVRHNGSDSDLEFLYNNEERLMVAEDGSSVTQTADTGIAAEYKISVDAGENTAFLLEEGANNWSIQHAGGGKNLNFRYNNTSYFGVYNEGYPVIPTYTVAAAPATVIAGALIYVSDGDAGSACLAVGDGTNWRVVSLGANISAT